MLFCILPSGTCIKFKYAHFTYERASKSFDVLLSSGGKTLKHTYLLMTLKGAIGQ